MGQQKEKERRSAGNVFESYSAGTEIKDHINPDAVRLMKCLYGINMEGPVGAIEGVIMSRNS